MGFDTSAKVNTWEERKAPKSKKRVHVPNVLIRDPLAARREPDAGRAQVAGEAGYTETSAPVSTRKGRLSRRQKRERDPEEVVEVLTEERMPEENGGVIDPRRGRFPRAGDHLGAGGSSPSYGRWQDPHNGKNSVPNEHAWNTRNGDHELEESAGQQLVVFEGLVDVGRQLPRCCRGSGRLQQKRPRRWLLELTLERKIPRGRSCQRPPPSSREKSAGVLHPWLQEGGDRGRLSHR